MAISKETIQAIIRDYHGFELSDEEIKLVQTDLERYEREMEKLKELDLSGVLSARIPRAKEGGEL